MLSVKLCNIAFLLLVERRGSTFERRLYLVFFCLLTSLCSLNPVVLVWVQIKTLSCDCELHVSLAHPSCPIHIVNRA
jgi:hypothetical protein